MTYLHAFQCQATEIIRNGKPLHRFNLRLEHSVIREPFAAAVAWPTCTVRLAPPVHLIPELVYTVRVDTVGSLS